LAAVSITPSSDLTTSETGGTTVFFAALHSRPSASVTFSVSITNTEEGRLSISRLRFAPGSWDLLQTVTVTGIDDGLGDGNTMFGVKTGIVNSSDSNFHGISVADVSVTNIAGNSSCAARFRVIVRIFERMSKDIVRRSKDIARISKDIANPA
jgi:hypothetical protein